MKEESYFDDLYNHYTDEERERGLPVRDATERREEGDPFVKRYVLSGEHHILFDPRTHDLVVDDNEVIIRPKELPK